MFWAEGTASGQVLRQRRPGMFGNHAWLQWGKHMGLWSVVRLKSQESDQTASPAMIRSLDSTLRVVGSQWFPAGV